MYKTVYNKNNLLNVSDMAREAGVHEQTIRKYIKGKAANGLTIKAEKLGATVYTTRANFEKWRNEYEVWKAFREGRRPEHPTHEETLNCIRTDFERQEPETIEMLTKQLEGLTDYDMAVHGAICSLYKARKKYIADRQVLEVAEGSIEGVTEKQLEAVRNSIEKMRFTRIELSSEKEIRRYGLDQINIDGAILSLTTFSWKREEQRVDVYELPNCEPMLLWYAEAKGQVKAISKLAAEEIDFVADALRGTEELENQIGGAGNDRVHRQRKSDLGY